MVWLQRLERYDVLAQFDPASGAFQEYSRKGLGNNVPSVIHGTYSQLNGLILGFFGIAGKFFLAIGSRTVEINRNDTITVSGPRRARTLRVLNEGGEELMEFEYSLESSPEPIPNDPTPFVEPEHFDIGLLASNISKSPERRSLCTDK